MPESPRPAFRPFVMERWQSLYENRVEFNLSESGVHPLTLDELLELSGADDVGNTPIGYGQSNGSDTLRSRIAALYPRAGGAGGTGDAGGTGAGSAGDTAGHDHIVVCNGSAEANFLATWHLVGAGDDVVILVPTYMQVHGLATSLGARVIEVPLREELGWQPDAAEIGRAVTSRTRMIVVTNPGNPTGAILNSAARRAIIDAAAHTGAWILADEVYAGAELSGAPTASFLGEHERVVAVGSLSKAYGLPGLRVGWAITDADTAAAIWTRSDYTTIATGALTDRLASIALDERVRPRLLERTRSLIRAGLDTLTSWMDDVGGFHYHAPEAGAICFARYSADVPSDVLAAELRTGYSVLVVPGTHFGLGPYIRFGIGAPADELQRALDRATPAFRRR